MNKKLLLGSVLVLTLLFLMPSIPAIQLKTYVNKIHNDFFTRMKNNDFIDTKNILIEGIPNHPILFYMLNLTVNIRLKRAVWYMSIASEMDEDLNFHIYHPFLFLWAVFLIYSAIMVEGFWWDLAEKMGWNWKEFI